MAIDFHKLISDGQAVRDFHAARRDEHNCRTYWKFTKGSDGKWHKPDIEAGVREIWRRFLEKHPSLSETKEETK